VAYTAETLTIEAGENITLSTNPTSNTLTVSASLTGSASVSRVNGQTGSVNTIEVGLTAPTSGNYIGKFWFDSSSAKLYVYFGDKWIGVG
jgi:hypothetical protein